MEHYQEDIVALSVSAMKNRLKRPLVEKSQRHIWFTKKPCYLRNHASQMKS